MIRPAIGTIATRTVITALNLLVVVAAGNKLGASGIGAISLLVLGITFILLLNNVVGGGGLVYLAPRHATGALRWPAYAWALLVAVVAWFALHRFPLVPEGLAAHAVALALLQSFCSIHLGLLLGRERIAVHNLLLVLQAAILLVFFVLLLNDGAGTLLDYVYAAYIAHGATAILTGIASLDRARRGTSPVHPVIELFRQGSLAQAANGLQLLNYRLAYYLVERFVGTAALGLYAVTTQLAESAWLAPKSLGMVLYARVSNTPEADRQRDLTLTVLKAAVGIALITVLALLVVPDALYRTVFGPSITGVAPLVLLLAPGLIAMSASQAISHYLSGSGRVHHNTIGSGLGLIVTVALGFSLIPDHGLRGAAITASAAYTTALVYQLIIFQRLTRARLVNYLPDANDVERLRTIWRRIAG